MKDSYVHPIVLGDKEKIQELAKEENLNIDKLEIIDPSNSDMAESLAEEFKKVRDGKVTGEQAEEIISNNVNYFGTC